MYVCMHVDEQSSEVARGGGGGWGHPHLGNFYFVNEKATLIVSSSKGLLGYITNLKGVYITRHAKFKLPLYRVERGIKI